MTPWAAGLAAWWPAWVAADGFLLTVAAIVMFRGDGDA